MSSDRARVHIADVIVLTAGFIAIVALSPVINSLIADAGFGPYTTMLLELVVPVLFLLLLLAVGTSAGRSV